MAKVYNMVGGGGGSGIKLQSISIITQPTKTSYRPGETFDPAGMVVQATYSNGSTATATGYTYTPSTPLTIDDTTITIQYTEQGKTATAEISITVQNEQIAIPEQSGALIYTGAVLTPVWSGYDSSKMTISGETSGQNAGSYNAQFTPLTGYCWPDETTGAQTVQWSIGKAEGSVSTDKTSVTLNTESSTVTVSVMKFGDGAITASSSDTNIAEVGIAGDTITISSVNSTSGTATVTITVAESLNYTSASTTVQVTATFALIYGVEWDGSQTTKLSRTDAAEFFTDPKPQIISSANNTVKQVGSSPFDDIAPWRGMQTNIINGNSLVRIPKYWVKVSHFPFKVQISSTEIPGYQVSPSHRDRGDGKGERDLVYIGRYECNARFGSTGGSSDVLTNKTIGEFRAGISALGDGYFQADYALQLTWWFLYIVEYADWDSQAAVGYGYSQGASKVAAGFTDNIGYHTGSYGVREGRMPVQYRNIENPWGNVFEWRDGIVFSGVNISTYNNPANFSDTYNGTGATVRSNKGLMASGYISAWGYDTNDPSFIYPSEVGGSETTFVPDYCAHRAEVAPLYVGGNSNSAMQAGAFFIGANIKHTEKYVYIGSRIQYLP